MDRPTAVLVMLMVALFVAALTFAVVNWLVGLWLRRPYKTKQMSTDWRKDQAKR